MSPILVTSSNYLPYRQRYLVILERSLSHMDDMIKTPLTPEARNECLQLTSSTCRSFTKRTVIPCWCNQAFPFIFGHTVRSTYYIDDALLWKSIPKEAYIDVTVHTTRATSWSTPETTWTNFMQTGETQHCQYSCSSGVGKLYDWRGLVLRNRWALKHVGIKAGIWIRWILINAHH